jgi:predicted RNA-binding Zn-ribbon protein involved in translation (DUF1610 family)
MDDPRLCGAAEVTCRNCGVLLAVRAAIIHMGAADLFVCPRCSHQEVWRSAVAVGGAP